MGAVRESNNPNETVLVMDILFETARAKECKRMKEAGVYWPEGSVRELTVTEKLARLIDDGVMEGPEMDELIEEVKRIDEAECAARREGGS